jgi:hypothetical protein
MKIKKNYESANASQKYETNLEVIASSDAQFTGM